MMALSGVRSSWLILARKLDFGLVRFFGAGLFFGVFLREVGKLLGLTFERALRGSQVRDDLDLALLARRSASLRAA